MRMKAALKIFVLSIAIAASHSGADAQDLKKVTLVHAVPQLSASFAADSSVPSYLGFWKEEGLAVEVNTTPGTAAAVQLVLGKQADIAVGNAFASMTARQKGGKVTSYYTSLRGDIFGVALPEGSGLQKLADLKGKVVGVSSFASGGTPYARALLAEEGLEVGKDVTLAEIGVGGRAAAALRANQVQALSLWDEMYVRMKHGGIAFSKIITDPRAAPLFVSNLVVNNSDLESRREILIGVARGIAKAQLFIETNPEAAVRIHWKVYPQSAPREGITDEAVKREIEVLEVRRRMQSKDAIGTGRYGDIPFENIKKVQDYFIKTGQIEKELDVREYYNNVLIDDINKFDHAAIAARAKSFKLD
jgi:NitT/TauT family transport system substrate-binding protein